uniref:ABC1 atypical kinase-like domain-containing protein n=1 Tax=Odontella aurita TaxID=265563 RepID=A0A7S4JPK1_9STRA|mmetsp:Transcript_51231/g.153911  ORF Transcript_51231/g.153911 Transcript_51231/m.153911 type:complete len:956 (+) Transcript_51231:347-3214(+)|eukprot:CAMPEP_0113542462 /NCGR_PEP_ID=MMETSP0015_2-20120614/9622_1 /TAXON_ID=2838 /ORGANISM="Odontella" /LENGTH=955 /DNA_ID=CAMNT_0000442525 /DNA_START=276 /DNA_END=3143 /DNA_ORIENTATION=- /assembly_acc=CAM_ASM_000160
MVRFASSALAALVVLSCSGSASAFHAPAFASPSAATVGASPSALRMASYYDSLGNVDALASKLGAAASVPANAAKSAADAVSTAEKAAVQSTASSGLNVLDAVDGLFDGLASGVKDALPHLSAGQLEAILASAVKAANDVASTIDASALSNPVLRPVYGLAREKLTAMGLLAPGAGSPLDDLSPAVALVASAAFTYAVVSSALSLGSLPPLSRPYPNSRYDPDAARAYFDTRTGEVLGRAVEVASLSAGFGLGLAKDYFGDKLEENADQRAMELTNLLTVLGPSFIKIGQSLSIRTDLLSPAYVRGLKSLQDNVPAFPTSEAKLIIEEELGKPISQVFSDFGPEPVAAASLGQVYKATLKSDGREVAIKVQRPDIMNRIALDMHLIREVVPVLKRTFNLNTDLVGVVDQWGAGFVDELDYISEARNAEEFLESIQTTPLAGVVYSPPVVEECTTIKVLTTEWVVGERLDKSSKDDVTILCSIAMNTYLTMMLETGTLHCDPHPGNLLRTADGRLCILDWGMVTKLSPDLQITLIEHMAHLTSADYEEIPRDLLLLGFIPEDKADLIGDSGIVEVLADIYGAWTGGGGAASVNVNKVISQLQDLTAEKGNLFKIPPYFAYIAKSFSVLEGIGLSNDAKYSIINECLPYVSKRLLTDKSDRTGGALSTFIFGPDKSNIETRIVDYDRVEQLITGFSSYSTSASGELLGEDKSRAELVEILAEEILDLIASEEETPLQKIFIEQLAKIISSGSRSLWTQLREASGTLSSGRSVLGTIVDPLGIFRTSPVVRMNELDEKTVETTRNLLTLMQDQLSVSSSTALDPSTLTNAEVVELSTLIVRKVWDKRTGVMATSNRLAMELLRMTADKLEKGEREVYVLPRADAETSDTTETRVEPEKMENERIMESSGASPITYDASASDSVRLQGARKILHDLEAGVDVPIPQSKPVETPPSVPAS